MELSSSLSHLVRTSAALVGAASIAGAQGVHADDPTHHDPPRMDARAVLTEHDRDVFRDVAPYGDTIQDSTQRATYAAKRPVPTQRPLLEWGRDLYREGPAQPGIDLLGDHNLFFPHFYVHGDWRTAAGYSDLGAAHTGRAVTRLNLDLDLGLTATERVHALIRPLDRNDRFTQVGFTGLDEDEDELLLDGNIETLFFEGDLSAMFAGPGASSIPIAAGKVPLLFQNGVWVEDAFLGVAVSFPAKNSPRFNVANYDWTFFAGFDDVTTGAAAEEDDATILGVTGFFEANDGYWEVGYAYADIESFGDDLSYHNVTASFSRRFGRWLSNSIRILGNFGQDPDFSAKTADGALLLVENSFITSKPYTVLPYFNLFVGSGTPQSLARDAGAGGVLKNTGLNFEADALTRFPALDATGHDAYGAALGVQYLFSLDRQLVLEVAGQHPFGDDAKAAGDEVGVGVRYQMPFELFGRKATLLRFDAMYGTREEADDISGARVELRWKF